MALKRQKSIRIANQERNLDEDDAMLSNRMAGESLTKEKGDDEKSRASHQVKAPAKKLADFADQNAKEPIPNEELSQLAYAALLPDLPALEKCWAQQMTNGRHYTSE